MHLTSAVSAVVIIVISGCADSPKQREASTSDVDGPVSTEVYTPADPCTGRHPCDNSGPSTTLSMGKMGTYTWDRQHWLLANSEYLRYLVSSDVRETHGDLYINAGDYETTQIENPERLKKFILEYRRASERYDTIVFITYGDVTAIDHKAMMMFTDAFFDWFGAIKEEEAANMGYVGISYDVEHMQPEHTENILKHAQIRKGKIRNGLARLVIQHTLDGDDNPRGTEAIMRYADSALAMLYSNYVVSTQYPSEKSILGFGKWLFAVQCRRCADLEYVRNNYRAKLSLMVETTCKMGQKCGRKSFCAYDGKGADQGFNHLSTTVSALLDYIQKTLPSDHISVLFNTQHLMVLHDWEWTRCMDGFPGVMSPYSNCITEYHRLADICRSH